MEGQSIAIEYRWAEAKPERLLDLAMELVRLGVDVIVTAGGVPPAQAAQRRVLDARGRLLHAALAFATLRAAPRHPALTGLHRLLDSWRGVGDVVVGMHRQGYDVQLTQYDERGWRAVFYVTGMEHSATSATASAFEDTPWQAVQRAAWKVLAKE